MKKKEIRKQYLEKRKQLSVAEQSKLDDLLLVHFQEMALPLLNNLFSFYPIPENKEPAVDLLVRYLQFRNPGLIVSFPVIDPEADEIVAVETGEETTFQRNRFNIYEPADGARVDPGHIDLVLVPLLAFDAEGYRVGYGKGYYDRFLAQCRVDCIKAGVSYFEPVAAIEDKADFDVPLDLCITPQTVYVF